MHKGYTVIEVIQILPRETYKLIIWQWMFFFFFFKKQTDTYKEEWNEF